MSIFDTIRVKKKRRSNFDLSHEVKTTTDFGRLTPFLCQEVLPGDSWRISSNVFARMAPMLAPIMSRVDIYTHYFFVPNRLLWSAWEDFITGGEDGTAKPPMPVVNMGDLVEHNLATTGSLADYLGLPTGGASGKDANFEVSILPFLAYQKIYNDWYRDQNLVQEVPCKCTSNGPQEINTDWFMLRHRAYAKDYFTAALPDPQKGAEMTIPMKPMEVQYKGGGTKVFIGGANTPLERDGNLSVVKKSNAAADVTVGNKQDDTQSWSYDAQLRTPAFVDPKDSLPTINELRRSVRIQEWLEANARAGSRYIEQIFSHFGVKSSDARLQRAELLGGGRSPIMISEVVQTSATEISGNAATPQGNMAGHGMSAQGSHGFKRYFEEHGFIIGVLSILPKATYQQGIERMWSRRDKFDYAWPELANLGEQEVLVKELWGTPRDPQEKDECEKVFGYVPRYSEYKYQPSRVSGEFRQTLNFWHLGRIFDNPPKLNKQFIECNPDDANQHVGELLHRVFAVEDGDHFWLQIFNNCTAKRILPYYGTPML